MSEDGRFPLADRLVFERLLPGPIDRVFAFLTEPDKRGLWLCFGEVDPQLGGTVRMVFHNDRLAPSDQPIPERYKPYDGAAFEGQVTAFEPPRRFAHTWDGTQVEFVLEPLEDGRVRLTLTQTGLEGADRDARIGTLAGWHTHFDILASRLSETEPESFWTAHARHEARYGEIERS